MNGETVSFNHLLEHGNVHLALGVLLRGLAVDKVVPDNLLRTGGRLCNGSVLQFQR